MNQTLGTILDAGTVISALTLARAIVDFFNTLFNKRTTEVNLREDLKRVRAQYSTLLAKFKKIEGKLETYEKVS
jgi:hypothetical protein